MLRYLFLDFLFYRSIGKSEKGFEKLSLRTAVLHAHTYLAKRRPLFTSIVLQILFGFPNRTVKGKSMKSEFGFLNWNPPWGRISRRWNQFSDSSMSLKQFEDHFFAVIIRLFGLFAFRLTKSHCQAAIALSHSCWSHLLHIKYNIGNKCAQFVQIYNNDPHSIISIISKELNLWLKY